MIKTFRMFESGYIPPVDLGSDPIQMQQMLLENTVSLSKLDESKLKKYFAQFGSDTRVLGSKSEVISQTLENIPRCSASVRGFVFNVYKLDGDDEWFVLSVVTYGQYRPVSDKWAVQNMHKPEYMDIWGPKIQRMEWYYSGRIPPKKGYEGMFILNNQDKFQYFKCDQIDGVLEKIDEYLKKRIKKDPTEHFIRKKEMEEIKMMKKKAVSLVSKMSKSDLENFIKSRS